jgi:hypothetical protein
VKEGRKEKTREEDRRETGTGSNFSGSKEEFLG